MKRLLLVLLAALATLGCGASDGDTLDPMSIDPWHQWGSTQVANMQGLGGGGAPPGVTLQQLVDVKYNYPTEWKFFFAVQLSHAVQGVPLPGSAYVDIALTLGIGRSNTRIEQFSKYLFTSAEISAQATKFSDNTEVTPTDPTGTPAPNIIRAFPAQSIQITAQLFSTAPIPANDILTAVVTAYVAPATHIRPEWFKGKFGSELGGR